MLSSFERAELRVKYDAVKELCFPLSKMVFHCHLFNTSGTLCAAARCHSASTSASGTVVLLHLTVSEAVTLQSGGTHHSAGLGLDVGAIFLWDIFQNTHSISSVDIIPFVFQTDIHRNCDLKQDTITRTCLPPPSINDKRKKKAFIRCFCLCKAAWTEVIRFGGQIEHLVHYTHLLISAAQRVLGLTGSHM